MDYEKKYNELHGIDELPIRTFNDLCLFVKASYFICPDEPYQNQYGDYEPWSIYTIGEILLEQLTSNDKEMICNDILENAGERKMNFSLWDLTEMNHRLVDELILDTTVSFLLRNQDLSLAEEKRNLIADEYSK